MATGAIAAEPLITVEGEVTPDHLPFHHVARYQIRVEGPADATLEISPWAESMPGLEIRRETPSTKVLTSNRQLFTQEFLLTPSTVQNYELPKVVVRVDGEAQAEFPPQRLEVRDLTPEERAAVTKFHPALTLAEAQARQGIGAMPWLLAVGGLLALSGVAAWLWRRRTRMQRAFLSWEIAEADLHELISLLEQRRITGEQFYVVLSDVLRDYVAARFHVAIRERSTPEFAQQVVDEAVMEATESETLVALLRDFDRVKFAQRQPSISQMTAELTQAREFVLATVPDETTAPPDGTEAQA